jgi:hypothetical protein
MQNLRVARDKEGKEKKINEKKSRGNVWPVNSTAAAKRVFACNRKLADEATSFLAPRAPSVIEFPPIRERADVEGVTVKSSRT